jgi:hypothetical protein
MTDTNGQASKPGPAAKPVLTLAELFCGRSAEEWRAEYAAAYDWRPDLGREIVED